MQQEEIIRKEARDFFPTMNKSDSAIEVIHSVRKRLEDFYSLENKAIFLDEIKEGISFFSGSHHHLFSGATREVILFYIQQEIEAFPTIARQKNMTIPAQKRNKVFVSYSHLDKEYLSDIQRHFKPFTNQVDFWDDSKILPGQKWKVEISEAIRDCKVAILLVSTDFLGSDFISSDELPTLLKSAEDNGATILIVILKPCLFEEFPSLNQYQTMNPPNRPLIKMDDVEREELYVNLVRQTKRLLKGE